MKLHDLQPAPGSRKERMRVGRGIAAGKGKTAGRGTKGQKSRAGGTSRPGSRAARRRCTSACPSCTASSDRGRIEYQVVNVGRISEYAVAGRFGSEPGKSPLTVNSELLRGAGLISTERQPVKVLGHGDVTVKLFVAADAFTKSAREKIEAAGGFVQPLADHPSPAERPPRSAEPPRQQARQGRRRADTAPQGRSGRSAPPKPSTGPPKAEAAATEAEAEPQVAERPSARALEPKPRRAAEAETADAEAPTPPSAEAEAASAARRPPPRRSRSRLRAGDDRHQPPPTTSASEDEPERRAPRDARRKSADLRGRIAVFDALVNAFRAPDIRRRILFVLAMLVLVRGLAHVPVPGVDQAGADAGPRASSSSCSCSTCSRAVACRPSRVIALGVNPYINASIIMQLMTGVVPRLQQLSPRRRVRPQQDQPVHALPDRADGLLQAYGYLAILSSARTCITSFDLTSFETLTQLFTLTAGTVLVMWIGELITERGIGNGISFIIFAGIVARVPRAWPPSSRHPDIAGRHRVRDPRHRRRGRHRLHPGRPAADPDPVRQPRPRPAHVPGRRHVPAAARQPGRRHPDHLRRQHPAVPGPDRDLLRAAPTRA